MFDQLTNRLEAVFKNLRGQGKLTEVKVDQALREVRRALLEADVNYMVARSFIARVKERAIGQAVIQSITPGQQVVKIVYDEMVRLMGGKNEKLNLAGRPPNVVMLVGLQGVGKTTVSAKLARLLKLQGLCPLLVAADVYRPAAIDQLVALGEAIKVPVHRAQVGTSPVDICTGAVDRARTEGFDLVILDTAGRLQVDEARMEEVSCIRDSVSPSEIIFVADAMMGQDAVSAASAFYDQLKYTGVVLTRLDSDTRGGAALSIHETTGVPIKFVGVSEKLDGLEIFHPDRMASRILGMGDVVTLVEKAQKLVDVDKTRQYEKKLRTSSFTFDDFLDQLNQVRQMGPMDQLLQMIPGAGKVLKGSQMKDEAFVHLEAIILSMTQEERITPTILNGSRRRRIARGSGCKVQEVNQLIKQFNSLKKMMQRMSSSKKTSGGMPMPFLGV